MTAERAAVFGGEGLCPRCQHRGACVFAGAGDDAVHSCPAFAPSTGAAGATVGSSREAGLCVNCAWRRDCRHPLPPGGVWHCEDYE